MTDRVQSLTVVLTEDMRTDDAQGLVKAISLLTGVQSVHLGKPVDIDTHVTRQRVRQEIGGKLLDFLQGETA
jgi:hypothetical protein